METELEKKLPSDYKKYPGKQDHCSCVAIRGIFSGRSQFTLVGYSSLVEKAQLVDKTLLRLFHKLQEKSRRQKNESFVLGTSCEGRFLDTSFLISRFKLHWAGYCQFVK